MTPAAEGRSESGMKALFLENIHPDAVAVLASAGFRVESAPHSPHPAALAQAVRYTSILGIRSKTRITDEVLHHAPDLLAIGAFCIGTDQIDLDACNEHGVAVFNAPYSNTRSVVELALGEMIILLRGVPDASARLHGGVWTKSSEGFHEIRGKRLGIIGYGNIGSQLSVLAEALGMEVCYHDVAEKLSLGNARRVPLEELLRTSNVVTVHVDGRESNRNFIGERELALMKPGAVFLNLSRGFVVDVEALAKGLASGRIRGAAIDVFPEEPQGSPASFSCPLQGMSNVILTPHVGGSTEEAQQNIGAFVAARLVDYLRSGNTTMSVNLPNIQPSGAPRRHRFAHIHENVPGMLARINDLFARSAINIAGQRLETRGLIGYALIDVNEPCDLDIVDELKEIPGTIRARVVC
jgi:D-3-phosphoglycerate dehydrogenase / 2-oxoglutarate reductase